MKQKILKTIFLFSALAVFTTKGVRMLDPDFGWHLRLGQMILSSGIPKTDMFSYTMPGFLYVDHEWLTDVLIASLYPLVGMNGLALLFGLLAILSLRIVIRPVRIGRPREFWYLGEILFLLAAAAFLPFQGVRPQVESWFFLAILLKVLFDPILRKRWGFLAPPFFILWANLHGTFAIGIAVLASVLIIRAFRQRKLLKKEAAVLILSLLGTLINPYGASLWREVWMTASDSSLRWKIAEWNPSLFSFNLPFLALLTLSALLVLRFKDKFPPEELLLFFGFLVQAVLSLRNIPLWILVSLPMTLSCLGWLYEEIRTIKYGRARFNLVFKWVLIGSFCIFFLQSYILFLRKEDLTEEAFYPFGAVSFLKNNPSPGQIFSEYGWGGYLIWKLPKKKVFIDGRMPSWRQKPRLPNDSRYAMEEYQNLLIGKIPYRETFSKYGIETVLWPVPRADGVLDRLEEGIRELLNKEKPYNLLEQLVKDGWQKVYQDSIAIIYQKSPSSPL